MNTENLFCPLKQHETRQDIRRDRKYYVGRCDGAKCAWWHPRFNRCAMLSIGIGVVTLSE